MRSMLIALLLATPLAAEAEPPLLSGEDAPPLEDEPNHLPLPEKTITIDGLGGVEALQREIDEARRRRQVIQSAPDSTQP